MTEPPRSVYEQWADLPPPEKPVEQSTLEIHEISVAVREAIVEAVREIESLRTAVRVAREATKEHELAMIQAASNLVEAVHELTVAVRSFHNQ